MDCPACRADGQTGLLCEPCGAILPARRVDAFAALGFPARFDVSIDAIDARVRELSRKLHPDRFARAKPELRLAAVHATTTLNDAARTMRDPVRRAEALLALGGRPVDEDERASAALLADVLELREALEDAKAEDDTGALAALQADVKAREAAAWEDIGAGFARALAGAEAAAADVLTGVRERLVELRYWRRFLDEHAGREAH